MTESYLHFFQIQVSLHCELMSFTENEHLFRKICVLKINEILQSSLLKSGCNLWEKREDIKM